MLHQILDDCIAQLVGASFIRGSAHENLAREFPQKGQKVSGLVRKHCNSALADNAVPDVFQKLPPQHNDLGEPYDAATNETSHGPFDAKKYYEISGAPVGSGIVTALIDEAGTRANLEIMKPQASNLI